MNAEMSSFRFFNHSLRELVINPLENSSLKLSCSSFFNYLSCLKLNHMVNSIPANDKIPTINVAQSITNPPVMYSLVEIFADKTAIIKSSYTKFEKAILL